MKPTVPKVKQNRWLDDWWVTNWKGFVTDGDKILETAWRN